MIECQHRRRGMLGAMRVLVAPCAFKESLSAGAVAEAIAAGVRDAWPDAEVTCLPIADGGDGTVEAVLGAIGGEHVNARVTGPLGDPVEATYAWCSRRSLAVIEMATAAGVALVPDARRDPTQTTTFGVGELVRDAMDRGARRVVVGLGGSVTVDAGIGAASAIGVRFEFDAPVETGHRLCGAYLARIRAIEMSGRDARIDACRIVAASDVNNPLCGSNGAAAVYGPQKGATPEQVGTLDDGLRHLAKLIRRDVGIDVAQLPGAGAAGGLGAGLAAFFGARLVSGAEWVLGAVRLDEHLRSADFVVTGEGRLDVQSSMGKGVGAVSAAARRCGVPVVAIAGTAEGVTSRGEAGALVDACFTIRELASTIEESRRNASALLREVAGTQLRTWWESR